LFTKTLSSLVTFKGIGSFLSKMASKIFAEKTIKIISEVMNRNLFFFFKSGFKNCCRKNYKNHFRSSDYEVCTAVAFKIF
jgi:hypothetical protein